VDEVVRASGSIDVFVVTDAGQPTKSPLLRFSPRQTSRLWQYGLALLLIALLTGIMFLLNDTAGYELIGLIYLFSVLLVAVYIGRGPAVTAAAVSALAWNFLFIEPRFTFEVSQAQDVLLLLMYFLIALFAGNMTARLRIKEAQAAYNAERTAALYALARDTASAVTMDDVLTSAVRQIGPVFKADVAILLTDGNHLSAEPHPCSTLQLDEKERSVARWAFDNGKAAGRYTDTLPLASAQYVPLQTAERIVGVLGIRPRADEEHLSFDRAALLETFANQIALVIERELLDEAARQSAMLQESERLYTTLLNSISHELRTPIATISGAASGLLNPATELNARVELTSDIHAAADRLNRLVENLLDMSRLESGRLALKREWCDVCDLIGVAAGRMTSALGGRKLTIQCPPGLPLVQMDFTLIEQVIVNLLDNISHYTPSQTEVTITAAVEGGQMLIRVEDNGPGIPPAELERIFEKFYRLPGTPTGGTGLGLSICRGLVEAHGGSLTAGNRPAGGAVFTLRLPVGAAPPPVKEATL
jgi:two-component system sensor histidine kinase KdpD